MEGKKYMKQKIMYILGGLGTALVLLLMLPVGAKTAISELSGLAVAQSSTLWNNVRDAAVGDNLTNGILATGLMLFDGTNFDRVRGDITNGMDVDVTRMPGGSFTPADGVTNPTLLQGTETFGMTFNGTTWDRDKGVGIPVQGPTLLNSRTISTANTATVLTLTGVAGTRVHLYKLHVRCSGGSSSLTITDGGTTIYDTDGGTISAGTSATIFEWNPGLTFTTGADGVVTIAACGTGNISVLNAQADRF